MKKSLIAALIVVVLLAIAVYFSRSYWMPVVTPTEEVLIDTWLVVGSAIPDNAMTGVDTGLIVNQEPFQNGDDIVSTIFIPKVWVNFSTTTGTWVLYTSSNNFKELWFTYGVYADFLVKTNYKDDQGNSMFIKVVWLRSAPWATADKSQYQSLGKVYMISNDCAPWYCKNIAINDFQDFYNIEFDFISTSECIVWTDPDLPDCDGMWSPKFDRQSLEQDTYKMLSTFQKD